MSLNSRSASPVNKNWLDFWPDGVILLDQEKNICEFSPRATQLLGWSEAEMCGRDVHAALCINARQFEHLAEDCPICADADAAVMKSGYWLSQSGEYVSVDFRTFALPAESGFSFVIHFYRNKNQPHSIAELNRFAEYVNKNPAALAEFDEDGQLLFCNPAMQHLMLAYGFNESGIARIVPANITSLCAAVCQQKMEREPVEVVLEDRWLNWYFSRIQLPDGNSVIGYAFDVTQQKAAEELAKNARIQARRDFFAKMVHELRTPLNAIVGYSDLLLCRSSDGLEERDLKALRGIKAGGMQLNDLISDTLDISKLEAGKMTAEIEPFEIQSVLNDINDQMTYLAGAKKLDYRVRNPAAMTLVSDRRKVRQILVNLVSNAIKYTRKGEVELVISGPDSTLLRGVETEVCKIVVNDTGVGIPEDQLADLFVEYRQVRERQNRGIQGTGLGLSLVSELVAILSGEIKVESIYGQGSCFTVLLPVVSEIPRE